MVLSETESLVFHLWHLDLQNMEQLVEWSDGLYRPPVQFKSW